MRNQLSAIRPEIPEMISNEESSSQEHFQNQVLRPILKFQNELIMAVFKHYIRKRKGLFYQLPYTEQLKYIETAFRKDLNFRHFSLGLIIGQMTNSEWLLYQEQEKELSRRIVNLLIQRIQDQMESLSGPSGKMA